jgi:AcrR family transcriptional regulator
MSLQARNRQVRKTRTALLEAFGELVRKRRYADIRVADIIRRADTGRSTFYEHFRDKDDILRQSLCGILTAVADAVREDCDLAQLECILEHFRDNRKMARAMLRGPSSLQVIRVLANLIEGHLIAFCRHAGMAPIVPVALASAQAAESQIGLIAAWLDQEASCSAREVAAALHKGSSAMIRALFRQTGPIAGF